MKIGTRYRHRHTYTQHTQTTYPDKHHLSLSNVRMMHALFYVRFRLLACVCIAYVQTCYIETLRENSIFAKYKFLLINFDDRKKRKYINDTPWAGLYAAEKKEEATV